MLDLTSLQKKILLGVYLLKGRQRHVHVARTLGSRPIILSIGARRMESDRAMDALSNLYSRGLLHQEELNRFVLTAAGREIARNLLTSRN